MIYRNNLKGRDFGQEAAQIFAFGVNCIAREQDVSENQKDAAKLTPLKTDSSGCFGIYRAQDGFVNLDSARQSITGSHCEHHPRVEKGEQQNRLSKAAASPNSHNLTERGIERLSIRNLILIETAEMHFGPGLNILTGETGSGKSAVLAAIRLILGERSDSAWVKNGAELAVVEASIRIQRGELEGIDLPEKDCPIEIRRELHRSGRSRCFIEDQQVSLQQLRQFLSSSIELIDQSASHKIVDPEEQRAFLDAFLEIEPCKELFNERRKAKESLDELLRIQQESGRDLERMQEDLEFIEKIGWQEGEEKELEAEHNLLTHAQELAEKLSAISEFISEGAEAILPTLKRFAYQLEQMQQIDPKLQESSENTRTACASLEEVGRFIVSYLDRLEANPKRLESVERRIAEIESIKRRFKMSQREIDALRSTFKEKLLKIDHLDEEIEAAKQWVQRAEKELDLAAEYLTQQRKKGAPELSKAVLAELKTMNLPYAQFSIELSKKEISSNGADAIKWVFAANPGQPPLSLDRHASGGELSRLLLAIKIALAGKEGSSCLIFDEIDSNVGGKTAAMLGEQLQLLSKACQLICVTHFVQVAKCAGHHFLVKKDTTAAGALTHVSKLGDEERLFEYARMTGSHSI